MRIALVDSSLFTIPYDEALAGALVALGCEPTLYGRDLRQGESRAATVPLDPFFYRLSERNRGRLPAAAFRLIKGAEHIFDMLRLRRRLAAARPDIIHFQWAPLPALDRRLVAGFRRIAPTILTVHDTTPFNGAPNTRLQSLAAGSIYGAFEHLIVHGEAGRAALAARGISEGRISVIPHGPLALPGTPAPARRDAAARIVLAFGKIKPYKGTDLLLDAFARLPPALRETARLRIVGEPFMPVGPLQERARALGIADRVDWELRYVRDEEIAALLSAADFLAFPYRQIDASGVLMTSLAYGKPIIASRLGAFAELIEDGVHGRLVPSGDVEELSAALAELLADPARAARMGEQVKRLAGAIPGWDEIASMTLALYRRLAAVRRRAPALQPRPYLSSKRTMSSSPR